MAIVWGAQHGNMQAGIDAWWEGNPAHQALTVRANYYVRAVNHGYNDDQTLNLYGDAVGTKDYHMSSPWGSTTELLVESRAFATNIVYGSTTPISLGAYVSGAYDGSAPSVDVSLSLPAIPYSAPRIPWFKVTRVSDTQHVVSWGHDYDPPSGPAPVTGFRVQRWDNVSGQWSQRASVGNTVSSWTDTGTIPDRIYRYRLLIDGPGGTSQTDPTGNIYTTPKAITSAPTVTISGSNIQVSFTDVSRSETTFDLQHRENGGEPTDVPGIVVGDYGDVGGTKTWTHTSPNVASTWQYRVKPRNPVASAVWSPWSAGVRILDPPSAPTDITVTRVSDTQHTVAWTASGTITSFVLERFDNVGAKWRQIATPTGSVRSFSDKGTIADRRYAWRVRAVNAAGTSANRTSTSVYTTPAASAAPTATKTSAGIVVTWTDNSRSETTFDVQRRENGGTWTVISNVATGDEATTGASKSWTLTSPDPAVTHEFQVRARNTQPGAWSATSNLVQLQTPPNPPTNLGAGTVPTDGTGTLSWVHNPADSADQTAYEVQCAEAGSTNWSTTGKQTSGVSSHAMPGTSLAVGTWDWRVRTWGAHADPSDWSATGTFMVSTRPTVAITAPEATTATNQLVITWGYNDDDGHAQSAAKVTVATGGETIHEAQLIGQTTTYTVPTIAENNTTYTITVRVKDTTNLWSTPATLDTEVDYPLPPTPTVGALDYDLEDGSVLITYDTPAPSGDETTPVSARLEVSFDNGETWSTVEIGLPLGGTIKYATPLVGGVTLFKLHSVSALPSDSLADPATLDTTTTHESWAYLSGGPEFGNTVRFKHGVTVESTSRRAKALVAFAGRRHPVEYAGSNRARTLRVAFKLRDGSSTSDQVQAVTDLPAPLCYRDPGTGGAQGPTRVFVSVDSLDINYRSLFTEGSVRMTQVAENV